MMPVKAQKIMKYIYTNMRKYNFSLEPHFELWNVWLIKYLHSKHCIFLHELVILIYGQQHVMYSMDPELNLFLT